MPADLTPTGLLALAKTRAERIDLVDRLGLLDVDSTWLSPRKRRHLEWGHGMRYRLDPEDFKRAAAEVACKRRVRLALAVSVLCNVGPGAARLARWRDLELDAEPAAWFVPRPHVVAARRSPDTLARLAMMKRGSERAREDAEGFGELEEVSVPPEAVDVFRQAREVGDGWKLLRKIAPLIEAHLAIRGGEVEPPRPPRPPRPGALVFPRRVFPGREPDEPLPEHSFRYYLSSSS